MPRHPSSYDDAPRLRHAPLREHQGESLADWITRQNRPEKPKQPRNFRPRPATSVEAAIAAAIEKKKGSAVAPAEPRIPNQS